MSETLRLLTQQAACNYLSISAEEAVDKSIYDAVPGLRGAKLENGSISLLQELSSVLLTERPLEKEIVLEGHKSVAQRVVIDLRAAKLNDGLVLTWRDITEKYQIAQQRQQLLAETEAARNQAEQANQFKDRFLSTVSHELRSPLFVIKGWMSLVDSQVDGQSEKTNMAPKAFKVIEKNVVLLENLVGDLLDVSRITERRLSFNPELLSFDQIEQIADLAIEAMDIVASAKQLEISLHVQPLLALAGRTTPNWKEHSEEIADRSSSRERETISKYVVADGARLQQVIRNLLSNAIKFTPEKGLIDVFLIGEEDTVSISIRDTGKGLKETEIPYLFERFWQSPDLSSENQRASGLGIGLSVSHYIMELHRGSIKAQSEGMGKGSTFTIELPTLSSKTMTAVSLQEDSATAASSSADQVSPEVDNPFLQGVKVLVVEDYPDALDMYKLTLETFCAASALRTVKSAVRLLKPSGQIF